LSELDVIVQKIETLILPKVESNIIKKFFKSYAFLVAIWRFPGYKMKLLINP